MLNSVFKGIVSMKEEMTTWYIFELISWLDKCVNRIHIDMFIEILNVINDAQSTGRFQSKWVDKVWDENCEHTINSNYYIQLTDINQNTFII